MKKILYIGFLLAVFGACGLHKKAFELNHSYRSERFTLEVSDYLNDKRLFTLLLHDSLAQKLGKCRVYALFQPFGEKKTYAKHLYTLDIEFENPETRKKFLIDDNYLSHDEKGNPVLLNQGKNFGYSGKEYVNFLPEKIQAGRYNFQVALCAEKLQTTIFSNVIPIELPLAGKNQ